MKKENALRPPNFGERRGLNDPTIFRKPQKSLIFALFAKFNASKGLNI